MKMKDQLESAQPLKKHKAKTKKADLKKKKQAKLEAKKQSKGKKISSKSNEKAPIVAIDPNTISVAENTIIDESESIDKQTPIVKKSTPKPVTRARKTTQITPRIERQRVSKSLEPMTKTDQSTAIKQVVKRMLLGNLSQGAALRELRVKILGLRQEAYTELTGVSRKTLSEIENNKGNYTPEIINKVFAPFDLKVGLLPVSSRALKDILNQ